ncbi:hypothetical protein CJ207_16900, partial [Klebsiella aerogenes]
MSILLKAKSSLARRIEKFNNRHVFHENSVTLRLYYLLKMLLMSARKGCVCAVSEEKPGEAQK